MKQHQQSSNDPQQLHRTTHDLVAKTRNDVERIAAILAQDYERKQRKRAAREARRARNAAEARDGVGRDEGAKEVPTEGKEGEVVRTVSM